MSQTLELLGKNIVITGASGGLGKEMALAAAKRGANLVLIARRQEHLKEVARNCQLLSVGQIFYYSADLSLEEERRQCIDTILQNGKVDVLINNAGYGLYKDAVEFTQNEIKDMFEVNVFALMDFSNRIGKQMLEQGTGHIIQIASQAGKMATAKSSIYSSTKFAVLGYTNALRLEMKSNGIKVSSVNPGPIHTDFFAKAEPTGQYLKALGGTVLDAKTVAEKIIDLINQPQREINIPTLMNMASKIYAIFPKTGDYFAGNLFNKK